MKKKSFTLVEVIVAAVILALVVVGMFVVFKSGERFSVEDKQKVAATNLNRQVIEHLQSLGAQDFSSSELSAGRHNAAGLISDTLADSVESPEFYYTVEDIDDDNDGTTDYKKVNVTYSWEYWEEGQQSPEQVELSTVISYGQGAVSEVTP